MVCVVAPILVRFTFYIATPKEGIFPRVQETEERMIILLMTETMSHRRYGLMGRNTFYTLIDLKMRMEGETKGSYAECNGQSEDGIPRYLNSNE